MIPATIFIISAPSGTGKSCIINNLLNLKSLSNIKLLVSHTTRAKRPDEKNGKHYFFISVNEFETMIQNEDFIEYSEVFGHYYGTSRHMLKKLLSIGIDVFLDINWHGAQQIRKLIPDTCSIFILPPSKMELLKRLHNRGHDTEESIARRMRQAIHEIKYHTEYDYLIINDNYYLAVSEIKKIICAQRLKTNQQILRYQEIINQLLTN
ncbi:MAG: guanylate kinase [Candidatus Dasytiphilus stammeri]